MEGKPLQSGRKSQVWPLIDSNQEKADPSLHKKFGWVGDLV